MEDDQQMLGPDGISEDAENQNDKPTEETPESEKAMVKSWQKKLDEAEKKYEDDFDRMRDNMDFVFGLQWKGQAEIDYEKYVANWTIRAVNQSVATLYGRNPQVEVRRNKDRLNYQMWDGKIETIHQAMQLMQMAQQAAQVGLQLPLPPDIPALLQDFQKGRMHEAMVDRVCKTLQSLCQNQLDTQCPSFKTQMKQLVRRVNVCGVGYIKVSFCREELGQGYGQELTQSKTRLSPTDRLLAAKHLIERMSEGDIEENSSEMERLRQLLQSFQDLHPLDYENRQIKEGLILDFPRATSIIPDPSVRTLKGFVGAHWVAEKLYFPIHFVEEYFEVDLKEHTDVKMYDAANQADEDNPTGDSAAMERDRKRVCVYVIHDLDTKQEFTICQGYKKFLCEPETVSPAPKNFWNIFPVTFNDIEVEEECEATVFPPSLVDLIKSPQKEWNRTRQALRRHRKANGPKYLYIDGTASEEDLDRIVNAEDQEFVKLKQVAVGTDPGKVVVPLQVTPIQPTLYNAEPLREDALLTSGQQEANQGPPQPNITATGVNVAEQSRMGVAASDIDGLDDSLTDAVDCGAQMLLMEMSSETVKRIVGPGAVWPDEVQSRRELLDEVEIQIKAGSSGKPNQAIELNKWQTESQILQSFGANPQAVIRETIKRFDDHLEPADFFPVPQAAPPPQQGQGGQQPKNRPPNQRTPQPNRPGQGRTPSQPSIT